jgi:hypothetical protein
VQHGDGPGLPLELAVVVGKGLHRLPGAAHHQ